MNRRNFFTKLASGLIISASSQIFVPKLIKSVWKKNVILYQNPFDGEAFAACIGPVINKILAEAGTAKLIFDDKSYVEFSFPLDLHFGPTNRSELILL